MLVGSTATGDDDECRQKDKCSVHGAPTSRRISTIKVWKLAAASSRFALDLDQLHLRIGELQQREAPGAIAFVRSRQHRFGLRANLRVQRLRFRARMKHFLVQVEQRGVQLQPASLASMSTRVRSARAARSCRSARRRVPSGTENEATSASSSNCSRRRTPAAMATSGERCA